MKLILIRGLPGSGKTTLANLISPYHAETDEFQVNQFGNYCFLPSRIPHAREQCLLKVKNFMIDLVSPIVVANTFSTKEEMEPYFKLANRFKYQIHVITVESFLTDEELTNRNITKTPIDVIQKLKGRWEYFL